jgi:hypothetical protein
MYNSLLINKILIGNEHVFFLIPNMKLTPFQSFVAAGTGSERHAVHYSAERHPYKYNMGLTKKLNLYQGGGHCKNKLYWNNSYRLLAFHRAE